MRYVIAYDVEDDGKRTHLSSLLLDYGDRVQKSVFEADLSPDELAKLLERASKYLDEQDSLRAYPLCQQCARGIHNHGRPYESGSPDGRIV